MNPLHQRMVEIYGPCLKAHRKGPRAVRYVNEGEWYGQYLAAYWMLKPLWKPGDDVVDLGCGIGAAKSVMPDVLTGGCDVHASAVEQACNTFGDIFWVGDETSIRKADIILCLGIFNMGYTWKDVQKTLMEAFRRSRKGVALCFMRASFGDPDIQAFSISSWLGLFHRLTPRWMMDSTWSPYQISALLVKGEDA